MKKLIFSCLVLAAAGSLLTACKKDNKENVKAPAVEKGVQKSGVIAYVEVDSFATQYEFCKTRLAELESTSRSLQQQVASKAQALEKAGASFYEKLQSGGYASQAEAEKAQAAVQKQQQSLEAFQQQAATRMENEQAAYLAELHDSIDAFMKEFNKDGRYAMILSKSGDNMLYADPKLDITKQVIDGMNKKYKKK